jgi:hypothetical protein
VVEGIEDIDLIGCSNRYGIYAMHICVLLQLNAGMKGYYRVRRTWANT